MARKYYVDVVGTVGSGGMTDVATTHTFTAPLTYADGATLPTLTGADTFMLSIKDASTGRVEEVVEVTAYNQSTGAATIARAKEGTSAVAHTSGDKVTISAYPSDFLGTLPNALSTKTTTYTAVAGDLILADASSAGFTITLPSAPPVGSLVTVQKTDSSSNIVTIDPTGSGTISGDSTATIEQRWAGGVLMHIGSDVWVVVSQLSSTGATGPIGPTGASGLYAPTANAQTGTSYTLVLTDATKFVTMSNASASTLTVPPNSSVAFPVGTLIEGAQLGAGQVTITPGSGVTVNATPGLKVAAQYGTFGLYKLATDTWLAYGRLSA